MCCFGLCVWASSLAFGFAVRHFATGRPSRTGRSLARSLTLQRTPTLTLSNTLATVAVVVVSSARACFSTRNTLSHTTTIIMAPNTSSVFNEAPPQPQQPETKPGDAGVLVAAPTTVPVVEPASVATNTAAASVSGSSPAAAAANSAVATDECASSGFLRRRRRQPDAECESSGDANAADIEDATEAAAAALEASERRFRQQLQMSRFARVSPAALDGIKPPLGFRKSCLKRSNSELPTDLSALKQETEAAAPVLPAAPALPVQKNRRRCWECKVKVGLTALTCRCDYTFCNKHRYAEEHKCTFDFKVSAKRKLEEENPRVVPSKVARIN